MKKLLYSVLFLGLLNSLCAQDVTTIVSGTLADQTTGVPLEGVNVRIEGVASLTTQSNDAGKFSLQVPVGRHKIVATSTGYNSFAQEILATAGKEVTVNISLSSSFEQLKEVEVQSSSLVQELAGQRSLTIEKTLRIPANFFDPVRVITAYPGVVTASDQGNSIIVRGNSPNGLSWKLNGVDIVNPNHLSNAGTFSDKPMANGGGVNIISGQMIDKTDFYTGQMPTSYGNSLAGIIDMSLREGNKQKLEVTAQASLIGLDVAAEGPLGRSKNTSFLVNYRYSTVGLLSKLGVDFGDETITFQDLSFHLNHRSNKGVVFSLFGFWGASTNDFAAKIPDEWEEEKDQYDINYKSNTGALGANLAVPLGSGKFSAAIAYSATSQSRLAETSFTITTPYVLSDKYDQGNALLSSNFNYSLALPSKILWTIGVAANVLDMDIDASKVIQISDFYGYDIRSVKGKNDGILLQPFTNMVMPLTAKLSLNAGIRYVNYSFNKTSALEPRASLTFKASESSRFDAAYGLISQTQIPQLYAINDNLELTKSHHFDVSHSKTFADDVRLKTELYYQRLFDVPVRNGEFFNLFSSLNFLEGLPPETLTSEGTGKNYGMNATVEKQFFNKHYVLLGGSYYRSTYDVGDGVERNSRFDGKYTFSAIHGKEWKKLEKGRTIGLNTRILYLGGMRYSNVLESLSTGRGETAYDDANPYAYKLRDYFRLDLRLSFRKNKPGYTRTFAIDIQNLTNQQNEAYQYYDRVQAKTVMKYHLGIIPVLVYRVDF